MTDKSWREDELDKKEAELERLRAAAKKLIGELGNFECSLEKGLRLKKLIKGVETALGGVDDE